MYKIMGEWRGKTEVIDDTDNKKEAEALAREYRITYGEDWRIWIDHEESDEG